jgi:hypothetical protein
MQVDKNLCKKGIQEYNRGSKHKHKRKADLPGKVDQVITVGARPVGLRHLAIDPRIKHKTSRLVAKNAKRKETYHSQ